MLRRLTDRRLPTLPSRQALLRAGGRFADVIQRVVPTRLPVGYEGARLLAGMPSSGADDSRTRADLHITPPPLERTFRETVTWLVAGYLSPRAAGTLAESAVQSP